MRVRGRNWLFTANIGSYERSNETLPEEQLFNDMFRDMTDLLKGLTRGPRDEEQGVRAWRVAQEWGTAGNAHLQGVVMLTTAQAMSWLMNNFKPTFKGVHFEVCRKVESAWDYCGRPGKEGRVSDLLIN